MTAHRECLPANLALYNFVRGQLKRQHGRNYGCDAERAAAAISRTSVVITGKMHAVECVNGVGKHGECAQLIGEFFGILQEGGPPAAKRATAEAAEAEAEALLASGGGQIAGGQELGERRRHDELLRRPPGGLGFRKVVVLACFPCLGTGQE